MRRASTAWQCALAEGNFRRATRWVRAAIFGERSTPIVDPPGLARTSRRNISPEPVATCDADKAKFAVGQPATPQLEAEARARAGARSVRTLKPNQAFTLEFNAGRLNLVVDTRTRVTAVRCG